MTDSRKVLSLEVGKLTDLGKIRQHLVDSLGFYKPDDPDLLYSKGEMFLVADGIGGQEVGAQAARMATDLIIKKYYDKSADADIETSLKHAFNLANMRIIEKNKENASHIQAGTSVTCIVIQRGTLHVAHIGNSRLYLIKGNKIKQVTQEHVNKGDAGVPLEQRKSGSKFEVARALGWDRNVEIDYFFQSLKPNDCLLLCTDGLFQVLDNQDIGRLALKYSPQVACEKFISSANEKGGPDNITTILIKINGLITIAESFGKTLETGINLINPATVESPKSPEPLEFRPGTTFRIERVEPEVQPEEPVVEDLYKPEPFEETSGPESIAEPELTPESVPEPDSEPADKMPPPIPTPKPLKIERPEYEPPKVEFTPTHPPAHGLKRRRNIAEPKKQLDFQKLFKAGFFAVLGIAMVTAVVYLLVSEGNGNLEREYAGSHQPPVNQTVADSSNTKTGVTITPPPAALEVQAGAGKTTPAVSAPVKMVLLNGNRLPGNKIQNLINSINAADIGKIQFETKNLKPSISLRSKILYRYPANGDAQLVRGAAEKVKQAIQTRYKKELEITRCDITLILGKDFRMSNVKTRELRRRILESNHSNPLHLEILNGSGKGGLGGRIRSALKDLFLDKDNYLKIIDVRNASSFDFQNTVIKCRPSKITHASKLAEILGLSSISRTIVIDDLEDIQLVLGRDFN